VDDDNVSEEETERNYVFGIEITNVAPGIQPLECVILVKGIDMNTGSPTVSSVYSDGITPWEAIGLMSMEMERLRFMTVYATFQQ
jgi:hypothetical protein